MTTHFYYGVHSLTMKGPFDSFEEANASNPRQIVRFETTLGGVLGNPIFVDECTRHLWFFKKYNHTVDVKKFINRPELRENIVHNVVMDLIDRAQTNQALTQDITKWIHDLFFDGIISCDKYEELESKILR